MVKLSGSVEKNQYVHHRGSDAREGELLLSPGFKISSAEVALLALLWESRR